jgi:hypothetical protein
MSYMFATLHQFTPRPGESICEAWEREQLRLADLNDRAIFATGPLECPPRAGARGWDVDVISHPDHGPSPVLQPVEDESIVPVPKEERAVTNHIVDMLRRALPELEGPLAAEIDAYLDSLSTTDAPTRDSEVLVTPNTIIRFSGLGITAYAARNEPEFGERIQVAITTDDLAERDEIGDTGCPDIDVSLNDADIYDGEVERKRIAAKSLGLTQRMLTNADPYDSAAIRAVADKLGELADLLGTKETRS